MRLLKKTLLAGRMLERTLPARKLQAAVHETTDAMAELCETKTTDEEIVVARCGSGLLATGCYAQMIRAV